MSALAVGVILAWLLLPVIGGVVTVRLLRRVWRERTQIPSGTKWTAALLAVGGTFGALGISWGLLKMTGAVGGESMDPSQKARILGEGIAQAMNWTAFALVIWLPSLIAAYVLMRKLERRAQ
ncbi:MAG TPA: MotA/TolQ/ExbB proton channel family protein [Polyangiaceae bacterium]